MADKYTWYLIDEPVRPYSNSWVLVADKRVATPVKAQYRKEHDYFEYDTGDDGYFGSYADDGCIRAWMPMPMFYG